MVTLEITTGGVILGIAAVGIAAYAFYRVGKNSQKKEPGSSKGTTIDPNKYIKSNPSTPKANQAFIKNIEKLIPYVNGVTEITIDKSGLTDAIISINIRLTAREKHKELYTTNDGKEMQLGQRYNVLSACWLYTTTDSNGTTVKKVVKKGIVELAE